MSLAAPMRIQAASQFRMSGQFSGGHACRVSNKGPQMLRRTASILVVAASLGAMTTAAQATPSNLRTVTQTIQIDSAREWSPGSAQFHQSESFMEVPAGITATVTVAGEATISSGDANYPPTDANGYPLTQCFGNCPLDGAPYGLMIATNGDGSVDAIGAGPTQIGPGQHYFNYNDGAGGFWDNAGVFTITVSWEQPSDAPVVQRFGLSPDHDGFVSSGVTIPVGTPATLTTEGSGDAGMREADANGYEGYMCDSGCEGPGFLFATVLGRYGSHAVQLIGTGPSTLTGDGLLTVGYNDWLWGHGDNYGDFRLTSSWYPAMKPVSTSRPVITGYRTVGRTLRTSDGGWDHAPTGYTYQYRRCDSQASGVTGDCVAITEPDDASDDNQYTLTNDDAGKYIRVTVTAANAGGATSQVSNATAVIVLPKPVNTARPVLAGSKTVSSTLTSSTGSWDNAPTGYTYQYRRCDSSAYGAAGGCVAITEPDGSDDNQYTLTNDDAGKYIRVTVTAANAGGATSQVSNATAVIVLPKPVNTALPIITGTKRTGSALTSSTGSWDNSPTSYTYQYLRCDNNASGAAGGCVAITEPDGSDDAGYTLTNDDQSKYIRVTVTATNTAGAAGRTSTATSVILMPKPVNTARPIITGPNAVGSTLTSSTGTWDNAPTSYTYHYRRCGTIYYTDCTDIADTDASDDNEYTLTDNDAAKYIRVTVAATNTGGTASQISNATIDIATP
jgi:hypothetical protein